MSRAQTILRNLLSYRLFILSAIVYRITARAFADYYYLLFSFFMWCSECMTARKPNIRGKQFDYGNLRKTRKKRENGRDVQMTASAAFFA